MPLYEYECNVCKRRFERRQSVHDEPIKECPTCGGETRKVIHPVGIVFKGSGFYVTDNRSTTSSTTGVADAERPSKSEDAKTKEESAKPASSEGSSESKPAGPSSSGSDAK